MKRELCSEEYFDLHQLGKLLHEPERYGVTFDRGTDPEAARIIDAGLPLLLEIWDRRSISGLTRQA